VAGHAWGIGNITRVAGAANIKGTWVCRWVTGCGRV